MYKKKSLFYLFIFLFSFLSLQLIAENMKYIDRRDIKRWELFKPERSPKNTTVLSTNFIENKGQIPKDILYYAYIKEGVLQIKKEGIYLVPKDYSGKIDGKSIFKNITLLEFINENDNYSVKGHKPSVTKYNYYPDMNLANKNKFEDIRSFDYITYHNVYHNIDLKVYKNKDFIEYDWIVNPGGKISDIKFHPGESKNLILDDQGNIRNKSKPEEIIHKKPISYQVINNVKKTVNVKFDQLSSALFGLKTDNYNPRYSLYIDPLIVVSGSYLGGTDYESPKSQAVDREGNLYMIGRTSSYDFPLVNSLEEPIEDPYGYFVVWCAKFDKDYKTPAYLTLFGQQWNLDPTQCAVDSNKNLYVVADILQYEIMCDSYGRCIDSYNAFLDIHGNDSTFTFALNSAGQLIFISLLGGTDNEYVSDIKIDEDNNVYITGVTYSPDFPVKNAYQSSFTGVGDLYLVKYTPLCKDIIYSTLYGDAHYNVPLRMDLDKSSAQYIATWWVSADRQEALNGVIKFTPDGMIEYNGYWFGPWNYNTGEGYTDIQAIAVDSQNRANIVGLFPGKYNTEDHQDWDTFFYILNPQGTGLEYSKTFSGRNVDIPYNIKIDKAGDIYISGETESPDFPLVNSYKNELEGFNDTFLIKIDHITKSIIFSTLFGGNGEDFNSSGVDYIYNIDIGDNGIIYLSGLTCSNNLPAKNAYQYWLSSPVDQWASDVFFMRLKWNESLAAVIDSDRLAGLAPASFIFTSFNSESIGSEITEWKWDFGDNNTGSGQETNHEFAQPGEYAVTLNVMDNLGRTSSDNTTVFALDHSNVAAEVIFEKNAVKANGKESVYGSITIKEKQSGSHILFLMQPVIKINNGSSNTENIISKFNQAYGNYKFQFSSGKPGKGILNVKVDGYLLAQAEIEYLWPQPPINLKTNVIVNRSLTRGSVYKTELKWYANPNQLYQIRKYRVFRSINDGNWELLTEVPYYVREYIDNSVPSPKKLKYAVSAVDSDGDESDKLIQAVEY